MKSSARLLLLVSALLALAPCAYAEQPAALPLQAGPHLFIDDELIDTQTNISRITDVKALPHRVMRHNFGRAKFEGRVVCVTPYWRKTEVARIRRCLRCYCAKGHYGEGAPPCKFQGMIHVR